MEIHEHLGEKVRDILCPRDCLCGSSLIKTVDYHFQVHDGLPNF